MSEPTISINGATLTEAQAMTVRVAITDFLSHMATDGALGKDETGEGIRQGYAARSREIVHLMQSPPPSSHVVPDIDGGRFDEWTLRDFAGQCRMQARDQLDPEFSRFMAALAKRLSQLAKAPEQHLAGIDEMLRLAVAAVLEADAEFRSNLPKDWAGDPLSDELDGLRRIFEATPPPPQTKTEAEIS